MDDAAVRDQPQTRLARVDARITREEFLLPRLDACVHLLVGPSKGALSRRPAASFPTNLDPGDDEHRDREAEKDEDEHEQREIPVGGLLEARRDLVSRSAPKPTVRLISREQEACRACAPSVTS